MDIIHYHLLAVIIGIYIGMEIVKRMTPNRNVFRLLQLFSFLIVMVGVYICWCWGSSSYITKIAIPFIRFALLFVGLVPGIGVGLFVTSFLTSFIPSFPKPTRPLSKIMTPRFLSSSLHELRKYEWQYLEPGKPFSLNLVLHKILDKISFGAYSRSQLNKPKRMKIGHIPRYCFLWESAAILVNPSFPLAYAKRALDGNLIFETYGEECLEGWDCGGKRIIYDIDRALVDTAIALHYATDWGWGLYVQGYLAWRKAWPHKRGPVEVNWVNEAKECFERSIRLSPALEGAKNIENCKEMLSEISQCLKKQ